MVVSLAQGRVVMFAQPAFILAGQRLNKLALAFCLMQVGSLHGVIIYSPNSEGFLCADVGMIMMSSCAHSVSHCFDLCAASQHWSSVMANRCVCDSTNIAGDFLAYSCRSQKHLGLHIHQLQALECVRACVPTGA